MLSNSDFLKIEKERFVTFFDALMAIIMTIMVLEIKIPEIENLTNEMLMHELRKAVTPLIGFLVSFGTLTTIWLSHHDMMREVTGINKQFVLLNFMLIIIMALIPFSTALAWGYSKNSFAVFVYALNIFLLSGGFAVIHGFAVAKKLLPTEITPYNKAKLIVSLAGLFLLIVATCLAFVNPGISLFITALIPLAHTLLAVFAYKFKN